MDAVHSMTSHDTHMSQKSAPRCHVPVNSTLMCSGSTSTATSRSAMASDTTKQLVTVRRALFVKTLSTTSVLPMSAARAMHDINVPRTTLRSTDDSSGTAGVTSLLSFSSDVTSVEFHGSM